MQAAVVVQYSGKPGSHKTGQENMNRYYGTNVSCWLGDEDEGKMAHGL